MNSYFERLILQTGIEAAGTISEEAAAVPVSPEDSVEDQNKIILFQELLPLILRASQEKSAPAFETGK